MDAPPPNMSHQVELKNRLKHLSYTEQLYIAVQTNAIASVQNLLTKKNPKNPKASTNDKCFYSASYYRVPQTDEFAALASQKGTKDQESKHRQPNSEGSRTTTTKRPGHQWLAATAEQLNAAK